MAPDDRTQGGEAIQLSAPKRGSPAEVYRTAVAMIRAGRSIDAIRLIRNEFGLSLAEAKGLVEAIIEYVTPER